MHTAQRPAHAPPSHSAHSRAASACSQSLLSGAATSTYAPGDTLLLSFRSTRGLKAQGFLLQVVSGAVGNSAPNVGGTGLFALPRVSLWAQVAYTSNCVQPLSALTHTGARYTASAPPLVDSYSWRAPSEPSVGGPGSKLTVYLVAVVSDSEWYGTAERNISLELTETAPSAPSSVPSYPSLTADELPALREYRRFDGFDFNTADWSLTNASVLPFLTRRGSRGLMGPAVGALNLSALTSATSKDPRTMNAVDRVFQRSLAAKYAPGFEAGGTPNMRKAKSGSALPSPRTVSNAVFGFRAPVASPRGLSELHSYFGQLVTMDLMGPPPSDSRCPASIVVPQGDEVFAAGRVLPFDRMSAFGGNAALNATGKGDPAYVSSHTASLDLEVIYSRSEGGCRALRTLQGGFLDENHYLAVTNASLPGITTARLSGDARTNDIPATQALALVFLREHNLLASELAVTNPLWDDETLFHEARRVNVAQWQKIVSREYIAGLTGIPLGAYVAFAPGTNPRPTLEAVSGAWRYGHAEVGEAVNRLDASWRPVDAGSVPLAFAFQRPDFVYATQNGLEDTLRGAIGTPQRLVGSSVTPALRHMASMGGVPLHVAQNDLLAMDVARGRDQGLPTYSQMRVKYNLAAPTGFGSINPSDPLLTAALARTYQSVDDVDFVVGGLLEPHRAGSNVGALYSAILRETLRRVRDADRFWFERTFVGEELDKILSVNLTYIIQRNVPGLLGAVGGGLGSSALPTALPPNVFFTPEATQRLVGLPLPPSSASSSSSFAHTANVQANFEVSWTIDGGGEAMLSTGEGNDGSAVIHVQLRVGAAGWVGVGWGADPNTMKGADIVLAYLGSDGVWVIQDSTAPDIGTPQADTRLNGTDDLFGRSALYDSATGTTTIRFSRKLVTGDPRDKDLGVGETRLIYAYSASSQTLSYHGPQRSSYSVDLFAVAPPDYTLESESSELRWAIMVLSGAMMLVALACAAWLGRNRHLDVVRHASFLFCLLICAGVVLGNLSALSAALAPSSSACMVKFWLASAAFVLTYGSIFVKTHRIKSILLTRQLKVQSLTNGLLLSYLGAMMLVELAILLPWTLTDPMKPTLLSSGAGSKLVGCASASDGFLYAWLGFKVTLLCWGAFLAARTRGVEERFNESAALAQSLYMSTTLISLCTLLGFVLHRFPNAPTFLFAVATLAAFQFTLATQMVPKVFPDDNDVARKTAGNTKFTSYIDAGAAVRRDSVHSAVNSVNGYTSSHPGTGPPTPPLIPGAVGEEGYAPSPLSLKRTPDPKRFLPNHSTLSPLTQNGVLLSGAARVRAAHVAAASSRRRPSVDFIGASGHAPAPGLMPKRGHSKSIDLHNLSIDPSQSRAAETIQLHQLHVHQPSMESSAVHRSRSPSHGSTIAGTPASPPTLPGTPQTGDDAAASAAMQLHPRLADRHTLHSADTRIAPVTPEEE